MHTRSYAHTHIQSTLQISDRPLSKMAEGIITSAVQHKALEWNSKEIAKTTAFNLADAVWEV